MIDIHSQIQTYAFHCCSNAEQPSSVPTACNALPYYAWTVRCDYGKGEGTRHASSNIFFCLVGCTLKSGEENPGRGYNVLTSKWKHLWVETFRRGNAPQVRTSCH